MSHLSVYVTIVMSTTFRRGSRFSGRVQHLQVVRIVHDAQDVPKGVDHGGSDEPRAAVAGRVVLRRPHRQQLLESCWHIVDVPVHDRTSRAGRRTGGRGAAIDHTPPLLEGADAKI